MATAVREAAEERVGRAGEAEWEPRVIAFLCSWCSYASADLAGASGKQYPANVRIVRVACAGRMNPLFIIKSLQRGADGVLVVGCHPGKCHYGTGNLLARRRFALLKSILEHVGVEPGRVHFSWVWASEGEKFARLVGDVVERVRALGPAQALVGRDPYAVGAEDHVLSLPEGSLRREQAERGEG